MYPVAQPPKDETTSSHTLSNGYTPRPFTTKSPQHPPPLPENTFSQPLRKVTHTMQNPPYIDVVIAFNVEHQIGIALKRPAKHPRQIQLVGVARHTRGRMAADM
ncbi:uncharacterized protein PST29_2257 [Pseudomonas sp. St29]|nr:uncharacterized protein PST29_2257 [Pseudomonas sp. St29]